MRSYLNIKFLQIYIPVLKSNDAPINSYTPHTFTSV